MRVSLGNLLSQYDINQSVQQDLLWDRRAP